jgi:DNA polymerase-3 subunit delta'
MVVCPTTMMPLALHYPLWQRFIDSLTHDRLPHALLMVGPLHSNLEQLVSCMMTTFFCQKSSNSVCQSCQLIALNQHPDVHIVVPDKAFGGIKIEQIRALHHQTMCPPTLGLKRCIIINHAERMTHASANALLMLLEDPPKDTYIILIAEQTNSILPTIISRCQRWYLPQGGSPTVDVHAVIAQGAFYSQHTLRGQLYSSRADMITDLSHLLEGQLNALALAKKWSTFDSHDLMWWLYLITAQLIEYCFLIPKCHGVKHETLLVHIAHQLTPVKLFKQLDTLHDILNYLNHTISINDLLMLENFLLGYG